MASDCIHLEKRADLTERTRAVALQDLNPSPTPDHQQEEEK